MKSRVVQGVQATTSPANLQGVQADGIAMAKGRDLAGVFPIGAIWVRDAYAGLFQPGSHGCTFGGNPLACAAALATLRVFEEEDILQNVRQQGSWLLHQLQEMASKHPDLVAGAPGSGLLIGLVLKCAVGPVVSAREPWAIDCACRRRSTFTPQGERN